jgi:hypothetical protein
MTMRIQKITLIALLALAASSMDAHAGQYHVYSCRTPSGQSAPVDGWSGSIAKGSAYDDYTKNTCPEGGALIAALGDQTTHLVDTDRAKWAFETPATGRLVAATLWRAGDTVGGATVNATYEFWLAGPSETSVFDECIAALECKGEGTIQAPVSAGNRVVVPATHLGAHLYVNVACGGPSEPEPYECKSGTGDPNGYAAAIYLFAADLTLEQTAGPSASNTSGELVSASAVTGTSDVAFTASDPGSGVYEALFSIDGQLVQSTVLNENGGRCRNVGQTTDGLPAFLYVQPCLASVSADVGFDTTRVSDGAHHLVVSVIDAAGNAAPVLDRTITVTNRLPVGTQGAANGANGANGTNGANGANGTNGPAGQPNGVNASTDATLTAHWNGTRNERLTSSYGRPQTIVGRLTGPSSLPIGGAQVDLVAAPSYTGAKPVTMTSPRTGPDGTFSLRLPGGACSQTLHLAYRSRLGDILPVATSTLTLSVRAGIALSISPYLTGIGRTIFFRGRLLGGLIPRGGKQLVLEARSSRSSWLEFKVIRANARGLYRASYRFKFPGPIRYEFRVVSEPEADYPFARGSSNVAGVRER